MDAARKIQNDDDSRQGEDDDADGRIVLENEDYEANAE
jgi:hypothetical protein